MKGGERFPDGLMEEKGMSAQKRWMETPCDIEVLKRAAQAGKLIASFGKRERIARKATREELRITADGDSWYVGYDA